MFARRCAALLSQVVLMLPTVAFAAPPAKPEPPQNAPATEVPVASPSSKEAVEAALSQHTTCQFVETPLADVAAFLRNKHAINVVVDKKALEDVGLAADTAITAEYSGIKLSSALNLMLRPIDLTWTIQDEVLLITTPEAADSMLVTKVYAVTDLVSGAEPNPFDGVRPGGCDYDSLVELISSTVAPASWDEVGGPGQIAVVQLGRTGALVISQTYQVHLKIADLLEQLRRVASERPGPTKTD